MPPKRSQGRPKTIIDWNYVGEMLEAGCFATGIAATIGCTEDTLYNRCKADLNLDFSAYRQQKLAKGDDALRKAQMDNARNGNVAMQIWLGKQRLGQADKAEVKTTAVAQEEISQKWGLPGEKIQEIAEKFEQ